MATASRCAAAGIAALAVALMATASPCAAADVSARAWIDPTRARVGDALDLAVEIRGTQSTAVPAIGDLDGLRVSYVGPSTQVSIVNGRMTASVTHHFTVVPLKEGLFTIGPIRVTADGADYDAGTASLQVFPGNAPAAGAGRPAGRARSPAGNQLRLILSTPKATLYVGERLPLRVQLYVGSVQVTNLQFPTVEGDGFSVASFPQPSERKERTPDGIFQIVDFRTVLTPLRSGTLTVGPARMSLSVVTRGRRADPFFGSFFGNRQQPTALESDPLPLTVEPLPEAGKPADFSGAVGRFSFAVNVTPRTVKAGDPVTLTMTIQGSGNLDAVTPPALPTTDALRTYPAQQTSPAAAAGADATQEKTFEQVVIPQQAGAVALSPLRFSYFDAEAARYETIVAPLQTLTVEAAVHEPAPPPVAGAAPPLAPPRPEETLGRDLVFIKDVPGDLGTRGARRHRSLAFWAYQPLPLLAWLGVVAYDRRRRRLRGDVGYARFTRAGREARRALDEARLALRAGDHAGFYDRVVRAVHAYLSAKLDLPPGGVTPEAVGARLGATPLGTATVDELRALLAACEHVRFAPGTGGDGDMQRTLERAQAIVRGLERARRLAPPAAATGMALALALAAGVVAVASIGRAGTGEPAGVGAAPDAGVPVAAARVPAPPAEHPSAIFFRANALYADERYSDAAAEYERVLAMDLESGPLYFNLGNAYFKAGDVGRAVLGYERARRLLPRDPDVRANLAYARSLSQEAAGGPLWAALLFPLAGRMTADELLLGAAIAYTGLMLLLIAARLAPRIARPARGAALAGAVALAALTTSAAYRLATVDLPPLAVVIADRDVAVRFEPSTSGTEHFTTKAGGVLRVLAERDQWVQVARADGKRGWIERRTLKRI